MWWLASVALVCLSPSSFYSLCVCGVWHVAVMWACLGDCCFRAARVKSRMSFVVRLQAVCRVSCASGCLGKARYLGSSCLSGFHLPSLNSLRNRENRSPLRTLTKFINSPINKEIYNEGLIFRFKTENSLRNGKVLSELDI